jgi:hypothetical protein
MSVGGQFANVAERLRGEDGGEQGRMLRAAGLKTAAKFFAFTSKEELIVKLLPAARVNELTANGAGPPCAPRKGRPMRAWVRLAPADEPACTAYVIEARNFVPAQVGGRQKERRGQWQRQQ